MDGGSIDMDGDYRPLPVFLQGAAAQYSRLMVPEKRHTPLLYLVILTTKTSESLPENIAG